MKEKPLVHSTTVIAVRRNNKVAVASDGQVTMGETVLKASANKVRRALDGKVLVGFAGSTADALTLFERFEGKLKDFSGNLARACVELAKEWRTDKALRRLDAVLLVVDPARMFVLTGAGDVIEPDDDVAAIGSGGPFALAAARALLKHSELNAREIAVEAMKIAAAICVYTNEHLVVEEL
jgi:ATP-dependent HslUV protease subunit HslV